MIILVNSRNKGECWKYGQKTLKKWMFLEHSRTVNFTDKNMENVIMRFKI